MILCRLRRRAALCLSLGLFLSGGALTATATTPVLESHMREFVYWTFGVGAFALFGAAGAFVSHLMARMEKAIDASISRLEKQVEALGMDLIGHNASALAHTAASEHNHGPMIIQAQRIEEKLDALILEHRVIRGTEDEVCSALRSLRSGDPKESLHPKRADDSGDDYTSLRGKNL